MPSRLYEEVSTLPGKCRWYPDWREGGGYRFELDEPERLTLRLKVWDGGRAEGVIGRTNLQHVLDSCVRPRRRIGRRLCPELRDDDDVVRARTRARQAVRDVCQAMRADRMLTVTTRAVIGLDVLLTRWQRFVRAYQRATKRKLSYCAVPELHKDRSLGDHFHLHVALSGFFNIEKANVIWWALCLLDDPAHTVNGNLDIKRFRAKYGLADDVVSRIAGYCAKYVGKDVCGEFNRKSYWASRVQRAEVRQIVLKAASWQQAFDEIRERVGVVWSSVLLTHEGCVFVLPNDSGVWFKLLPDMARVDVPF